MLKDSQHIGHSSPSSLPTTEETSSSEQSQEACAGFEESFFDPTLPAMQLDAKFHMFSTEFKMTVETSLHAKIDEVISVSQSITMKINRGNEKMPKVTSSSK